MKTTQFNQLIFDIMINADHTDPACANDLYALIDAIGEVADYKLQEYREGEIDLDHDPQFQFTAEQFKIYIMTMLSEYTGNDHAKTMRLAGKTVNDYVKGHKVFDPALDVISVTNQIQHNYEQITNQN